MNTITNPLHNTKADIFLGECVNEVSSMSIDGVELFPLRIIRDDRGAVMHMMRNTDPHFKEFGEIYFSIVNSHQVKGWKKHKRILQFMTVPEGEVQIVIYDDRADSSTYGKVMSVTLSPENYHLLKIPALVWYSFKSVTASHSIIANCTTAAHDPTESEFLPTETPLIPYKWN